MTGVVTSSALRSAPLELNRYYSPDELWRLIVVEGNSFWKTAYPLFMGREIARPDVRELLARAYLVGRSWAQAQHLLHIHPSERKRFSELLRKHQLRPRF